MTTAEETGVPADQEFRLRHLADIQSTIVRLSQYSLTVKGWSVTLVSIVAAFIAAGSSNGALALIAAVPTAIFWWLDGYYIHQERLFRAHYRAVAHCLTTGEPGVDHFDMTVDVHRSQLPSQLRVMMRPHIAAIPLALILLVAVVAYAVR